MRKEQIERLQDLKAHRDEAAVKAALDAITECVKTKKGNLLDLAVKAAKVRATLGEISDACEVVVGRYKAVIRTISGVYSSETKKDADFVRATELCEKFAKKEGRQPRIMIAKMGQDGHDRGAKVVATGYADCGFDVDMGPLFQTPGEAARQAVENDVHVLGVSSLAAGHKTLVPQVIEELKNFEYLARSFGYRSTRAKDSRYTGLVKEVIILCRNNSTGNYHNILATQFLQLFDYRMCEDEEG